MSLKISALFNGVYALAFAFLAKEELAVSVSTARTARATGFMFATGSNASSLSLGLFADLFIDSLFFLLFSCFDCFVFLVVVSSSSLLSMILFLPREDFVFRDIASFFNLIWRGLVDIESSESLMARIDRKYHRGKLHYNIRC